MVGMQLVLPQSMTIRLLVEIRPTHKGVNLIQKNDSRQTFKVYWHFRRGPTDHFYPLSEDLEDT